MDNFYVFTIILGILLSPKRVDILFILKQIISFCGSPFRLIQFMRVFKLLHGNSIM